VRESTHGERGSIVPLLAKSNGDAVTNSLLRRDSDDKEQGLKPDVYPLKKQSTQDTKISSSARTSRSDDGSTSPQSIIPTKGQKGDIGKCMDFDLNYSSGRRFCGMYLPTMSTAFDPTSAEDLYQRYVFR